MIDRADYDRLDAVLARLAPPDATWVENMLLPQYEIRARKLLRRDSLIRGAAAMIPGSTRAQAETIAAAMAGGRTGRGAWPDGFGALVEKARALNAGRTLAWRQIAAILAFGRAPPPVQKSEVVIAQIARQIQEMENTK